MHCRDLFPVAESEKSANHLLNGDGKIDLTWKVFATDIASVNEIIIYFLPFRSGTLNTLVKKGQYPSADDPVYRFVTLAGVLVSVASIH